MNSFNSAWLHGYENRYRGGLPDAQQRQCEAQLAGSGGGEAPGPAVPVVRFRLYRVGLLDVDAKYASVKDLLDGLQYAGLIPGDKEGQIRLEVTQEKVAHYAQEQTIIEIETPDEKDSTTGE